VVVKSNNSSSSSGGCGCNAAVILRINTDRDDYIPGRAVRSAGRNLICERRTKTASGARAFGVVAPKVWHDLPDSVRYNDYITSFKKNLKTYLYNQAFTC